ncbi:MAG: hypothetical protein RLZZ381_1086 [Cyanobacteriota bacterium]|jgi:vacuolar-type H+-ATPase subunit E/Vma4
MTSSNGNNSGDRLSRIEAIVESNSRTIQAMMEPRATDRLEHEERMRFLEENQRQLIQTQRGIANLVSSLDEDRPTILRKLTVIENKVDSLIEGNQ